MAVLTDDNDAFRISVLVTGKQIHLLRSGWRPLFLDHHRTPVEIDSISASSADADRTPWRRQ